MYLLSEPILIQCKHCEAEYYTENKHPFTMWEAKSKEPTTVSISLCPQCGKLKVEYDCPIIEGNQIVTIDNIFDHALIKGDSP